jgi:hypothetical protein
MVLLDSDGGWDAAIDIILQWIFGIVCILDDEKDD